MENLSGPKKIISLERKQELNKTLFQAERSLLWQEGLPRRPCFKNYIAAPGFYTGYGAKTLLGIREAIGNRNWQEAKEQIRRTADFLERYDAAVQKGTAVLNEAGK